MVFLVRKSRWPFFKNAVIQIRKYIRNYVLLQKIEKNEARCSFISWKLSELITNMPNIPNMPQKRYDFKNSYFLLPRQIDMYETVLIQPFYFLHDIKY